MVNPSIVTHFENTFKTTGKLTESIYHYEFLADPMNCPESNKKIQDLSCTQQLTNLIMLYKNRKSDRNFLVGVRC